jgi:hypothetical protein
MFHNSSNILPRLFKRLSAKSFILDIAVVLILLLGAILINWKMLRNGLNGHSDMPLYVTWLQHFSKQISEGIWYPRWLAGTNFGYGSPTFVFYPPFVYFLGSLLKLNGLTIEQTVITLFTSSYFAAGLGFYLYARQRWAKIPSLIGALAYISSASLCFTIYFRSALSEAWGLALVPWILWLTERTEVNKKWGVALSISLALLISTHIPTSIIFILIIYPLYFGFSFIVNRSWKPLLKVLPYIVIGLGIISIYTVPIVFEKPLVFIERMRNADGGFSKNFLSFQLSNSSQKDLPSYFIKINQIFTYNSLAAITLIPISAYLHRENPKLLKDLMFWSVFSLSFFFLMLSVSNLVWSSISVLQMVQFPWRMLGILSLGVSMLIALSLSGVNQKNRFVGLFLIVIASSILFWNFNYSYTQSRSIPTIHAPGRATAIRNLEYFKTVLSDPYTDKLVDVRDYRPLLQNKKPVPDPQKEQPKASVTDGNASIQIQRWESYDRIIDAKVTTASTIKFRTYYYPAWHLYVNGRDYPITVSSDGTIEVSLEPGIYQLQIRYLQTQAFRIGIGLTIISLLVLILLQVKSLFTRAQLPQVEYTSQFPNDPHD